MTSNSVALRVLASAVGFTLVLLFGTAIAQPADGAAELVGARTIYDVRAGDSLASIGARFGVARVTLIEMNQLTSPFKLAAGQSLVIDNTHVAVASPLVNLTINIPQRMLVLRDGENIRAYPVTVGKRTWPTPVGAFTILSKETDPVWSTRVHPARDGAAR